MARLESIWREMEIVCPSSVWFHPMVGVQTIALSFYCSCSRDNKKLKVVPDDWTLPFFILE